MCCEPLPGCSHIQMSVGTCSRFCLRRRVSSSAFVLQGNKTCFVVFFSFFFFYFNSCSVGGESSLMCKKYLSGVSSLSLNSPRKVRPSLLLPLRLYSENMRLWTLALCDITEGTGTPLPGQWQHPQSGHLRPCVSDYVEDAGKHLVSAGKLKQSFCRRL